MNLEDVKNPLDLMLQVNKPVTQFGKPVIREVVNKINKIDFSSLPLDQRINEYEIMRSGDYSRVNKFIF